MQRIVRYLLPAAVLLLGALGLVACGSSGSDSASADTDVNTLLDKTFNGDKPVKSGKLDLSIKADASGGANAGSFSARLAGPFQTESKNELPKFALSLDASGQGQSIKAGATSTGEKGYVNFNGQDYSIPDNVFQQFKQGYEQAAQQGRNKSKGASLATLGIDPQKWLTNPKNEGEDKVGDTDVIKISGGVDVGKMLDDLDTVLAKAGSLGLQSGNLPTRLTEQQKQAVEKSVKNVAVEIYTGKDDTILRRLKVALDASDPNGSNQKIALNFDLQFLDVNEDQDIPEPSSAKPLDQLLQQFGGLGGLSGLGGALGGSGSSSSGSGSSSSGGSAAASQQKLKKYSQCLQAAGQDVQKAQKCASILTP